MQPTQPEQDGTTRVIETKSSSIGWAECLHCGWLGPEAGFDEHQRMTHGCPISSDCDWRGPDSELREHIRLAYGCPISSDCEWHGPDSELREHLKKGHNFG